MKTTDFSNVYWICGSSRAGKTTIANIIEKKYGYHIYHLDNELFMKLWPSKVNKEEHPFINQVISFNQDYGKIYRRPMEEIMEETFGAFNESWEMLYEDLLLLSKEAPVIIEGASVFPEMLSDFVKKENIIFLVPTKELQKRIFMKGMFMKPGEEPKDERQLFTQYPEKDFLVEQRITHHDLIAQHVVSKAELHGYKVITVENEDDLNKNIDAVIDHFGF